MRGLCVRVSRVTLRVILVMLGPFSVMLTTGCSRDAHTLPLSAPYNDDTVGVLSATWTNSGEERAFSGGARLKEPEVRFRYRLDARNDGKDKLYLRLSDVTFADSDGLALGSDPARIACTLNAGQTDGILAGDIWVPKAAAEKVHGVRVSRVAVPLGTAEVTRYRAWLLQGRPNETAQVDAEIAALAAAPTCGAR